VTGSSKVGLLIIFIEQVPCKQKI